MRSATRSRGAGFTRSSTSRREFSSVYDPELQLSDHRKPIRYAMSPPPTPGRSLDPKQLYVHAARGRKSRATDDATEEFVEATRMGTGG